MTTALRSAPRIVGAVIAIAAIFVARADSLDGMVVAVKPQPPVEKPGVAFARPGDTVEVKVDRRSLPPTYPAALRAARFEGQVVARFVVRANGQADTSTFALVKSDHDLFTTAVREALPYMRFIPATIDGVKVDRLATMPFVFSLWH